MKIIPKAVLEQHVAILGKTRSGKSSVMRVLVESLLDRQQPVCIVDPKGDWWGLKLAKDGKGPGYPVVIFGGEHADIPINEHAGAHVAELFASGNRPCLIDLGGWMVGPRTRFWIDFASTLFKHTKGQRWLAVDEIHNFAPKGKVFDAEAGKALHWTNRLASEGLGKGVAMIFASQRPQKVHNDTLTSAETLIAMRVLHPSDRGAVADWIKGCGDSDGGEVLNSLARMERGEGWVWSPEIGFGPKRVKFPLFGTYDSFRPQSVEDTKRLKGWAEVDLDEVRSKLAAVVEQAKADDPRELKRLLAQASKDLAARDRQIKDLDARPVTASGSSASIEARKPEVADLKQQLARVTRALGEAVKFLVKVQAIDFQAGDAAALEQAVTTAVNQIVAGVEKRVATVLDRVEGLKTAAASAEKTIRQLLDENVDLTVQVQKREPFTVARPTAPAARPPARQPLNGQPLTSPELKILTGLAELEALRLHPADKQQLGLMAGYTNVRSGGFSEPLGRLIAGGYAATPSAGRVAITDLGRSVIGTVQAPTTAEEMQARMMAKLSGPEQRILRVIIGFYPQPASKEQIAASCDPPYTNIRSGGFSEPLGRLNTLGIVSTERGMVLASPALFLEA